MLSNTEVNQDFKDEVINNLVEEGVLVNEEAARDLHNDEIRSDFTDKFPQVNDADYFDTSERDSFNTEMSEFSNQALNNLEYYADSNDGEHYVKEEVIADAKETNSVAPYNEMLDTTDYLDKNLELDSASHQHTSAERLDDLVNSYDIDEDAEVVKAIAENSNTSTETLDRLADSKDEEVREAVMENPNTSEETLEKLDKAAALQNDFAAFNQADEIDIIKDGKFDNDNDKIKLNM